MEKRKRETKKQKIYSNSITSLNSISEKDTKIKRNIQEFFFQTSNQFKLAEKLKNYYLNNNPNTTWKTIFHEYNFFEKFKLKIKEYREKQLLFPSTLLQFMSLINNLHDEFFSKKDYGTDQLTILSYFLTIVDTINIKVLYVICSGNNYYLSPLNIKKIRTQLRKKTIILNRENIYDFNEQLRIQYKNFKNDNGVYIINGEKYDFVFISNAFKSFIKTTNKLQIFLGNIDLKQHYKASILSNNIHAISINKCNQYNILNTTWKPFNIYNITDFKNNRLYIDDDEKIFFVDKPDPAKESEYYYLNHKIDRNFEYSLFTINLYSNRVSLKSKIYKQIEGGTNQFKIEQNIPEVSICSKIFFPHNLYGFCWFSSIINSLFYTDDIASIFINKSIRNMDNTLKFLHEFYSSKYKTIDFTNQKELKKILKHLIYLMSFIYCSYSILSKNQLDERITNKKKWYEIYEIITDKERYKIIATIILGLSNIKNFL